MQQKLRMLLAAAVIAAIPTYAQEVRASLAGVVSDPVGAPIPGVTVVLTSVERNVATTTETNEQGNYLFPFVVSGKYTLTIERPGFKKYLRQNIILQAQDKARADVALEVGDMTQSVSVQADVSQLQTETASRSQIVSNQLIANLPTQGRNPFQIAWAMPGVVKTGDWRYLRAFDTGGMSGFSINGGKKGDNEVLIDGISNVRGNRNVIGVPSMEAVQEFKVLTNTYDSQYGRTGGGIVTIVSKSGGNAFHGTAYEYFQAEELNANQSELNSAGAKKPPMNINTFGFQASGPIFIPKVFDGRNKLFFLLSYEGLRQRSADPGAVTFPLDAWRTGNFSGLQNAQGAAVTLYDPLTTDAAGNRTPFAGNIIPTNRINPVAANVLKDYPSPNAPGTGPARINNYIYPSRWVADMNAWNGRLDYRLNDRNTVYFRYGQAPFSEYRALVWNGSNAAEPTGNAPLIRNGRNWVADWTTILSPTMTFNLRGGLARWETSSGNSFGANYNPATLGFASSLVSQLTRFQYPRFDFSDTYQSIGSGNSVFNASPSDTYTLQPNLNIVRGNHTLKFGGEARRYHDNSNNPGASSGVYGFSRAWTQAKALQSDSVSGNEIASFLLGAPNSAYVERNIDPAYRNYYFATFFQDDWRLNNRLTLNFGLRWDYEQPLVERYNRMLGAFNFTTASPIAAQTSGLSLVGVPTFAGVAGQARGAFATDRNNWQPRVGAAYRIAPTWVIRGGYGIYYLGQNERGEAQGFSQRTNAITSTDGNLKPAVDLTNAFSNQPGGQLLSPIGASQGASSFLGQSMTVNYYNRPLPYTHQFSFDIQHELPGNMLAEIGYAGNISRKLPINVSNYNVVPAAYLGRRTSSGTIDSAWYTAPVANPMAGLIPSNPGLNGATIPRQNLLFPFPQFSGININNLPIGGQNYNGLQTRLTKRFSRGLTFVASYSWSKTLEQLSLLNAQDLNLSDVYSSRLENRSAQETDVPHKFSFAGVYELPFGRGRSLGNNMNKVADAVLGGWQLNWNLTLQSGWALDYPNVKQVQNGDARPTDAQKAQGYLFNVDLWNDPTTGKRVVAQQEPFTLRDFPTRFGSARVPGYKNIDASVAKNFRITESMRLQFRGEMVNATNSPWFSRLASNGTNVTNANFGKLDITQRNLPRFVKLVLNLSW
ncbi:TonB-dependent receptor domain-containing protein [Paludibaculum fermentans]|uniref:TonB-dependent receptor n=1 Tax=Paludibaculum fermentans TaxID=1473598 RepID=UPI003EB9BEA1